MTYETFAAQFVPKRWKVEYRKALTGRCIYARRTIAAPRPTTLLALHIFMHECGHAWLHGVKGDRKTKHRIEFEAETWAFAKMREGGIEPDPRSIERAKSYVRRKIDQAVKRGAKCIDVEAAQWAEWSHS